MLSCRALLLAMVGTAVAAGPAFARSLPDAPATVRDLAWGEVLFHHYQADQMSALVRLAVAEARGELPHHGGEARLLTGGLYLAWGLRDEAATIFEALLAEGAPAVQRDQAWYWLGRIYHERGEHERAAATLARIGDRLSPAMAADRVDLEGRVLIAIGRYPEAARLLAEARQTGAWQPFAQFNRAVALLRAGRHADALVLLEELGVARRRDPELLVLRDRANLVLGLARLDGGDAAGGRRALDRVRLESPYASRALLAAGWAEAGRERYREALGPWSRLAALADADGASLEAMLAVPWAWHQLDETGASVLGYRQAAAACEAELARLDRAVELADGDALLDFALAEQQPAAGPLAEYLHAFSVDHPFRAVAADLRDLNMLRSNLLEWRQSLAASRDMVEARRARFGLIAPRAAARLEEKRLAELASRYAMAAERLEEIRVAGEPAALAMPGERRLLARLAALESRIHALPGGEERLAYEDRLRRLSGAMAWRLNHEWPARIHEAERTLRATARALDTARAQRTGLAISLAEGPARFEGFDGRIDAAADRVDDLLARVEAGHARSSEALTALVLEELHGRQLRVSAYLGQARFALATAYDQAAQSQAARGAAGGRATVVDPGAGP